MKACQQNVFSPPKNPRRGRYRDPTKFSDYLLQYLTLLPLTKFLLLADLNLPLATAAFVLFSAQGTEQTLNYHPYCPQICTQTRETMQADCNAACAICNSSCKCAGPGWVMLSWRCEQWEQAAGHYWCVLPTLPAPAQPLLTSAHFSLHFCKGSQKKNRYFHHLASLCRDATFLNETPGLI